MPEGGILINTARGEVVNLDDVERCLREEIIAGVGLDVLPDEPIPIEGPIHPLLQACRRQEDWKAFFISESKVLRRCGVFPSMV